MSGSARWKEERIRQEVYLEHLRYTEMSPNGAGRNGGKLQVQTSIPFIPQPLANRSGMPVLNRRKKNKLPWMMLRVALLGAWAAICVWVYLGQFGIHR